MTTMTTDGRIGAEVAHVPTDNSGIKDGAIDFVAGSLGKFRDSWSLRSEI